MRAARGYREYRAGHPEDVIAVFAPLARHPQWLEKFTQVDGWVMPKHAVLPRLPAIRPQLRPDSAVVEAVWEHRHSDRVGRDGEPLSDASLDAHVNSKNRADEHVGVGWMDFHRHKDTAKYALAPESYVELFGERVPFDDSIRLDRNPLTDFAQPGRTFFVIEGSLKGDAIVSQGEKAFSVPGVGMWHAPELALFALTYLRGPYPTIVVPDADWATNLEVVFHATACCEFLRSLGVLAYIAAPPIEAGHKGVDDYLANGGTVDDLRVLQRVVDEDGFSDWADFYRESGQGGNGKRGRGKAATEFDIEAARAVTRLSLNGRSIRSTMTLLRAMNPLRDLTIEEARALAVPLPVVPALGREYPELSRFRSAADTERAIQKVVRSLHRLDGPAYEGTGEFPSWVDPSWEYGKRGKRYRSPGGLTADIEIVALDPRLRLIDEDGSLTVADVCRDSVGQPA